MELIVIYGAAQAEDKEQFLIELTDCCSNLVIPTVIGGDFNILRFGMKKIKQEVQLNSRMFLMQSLILMLCEKLN
jgi:hypothetical protein